MSPDMIAEEAAAGSGMILMVADLSFAGVPQ